MCACSKALRVGKFLSNVHDIRSQLRAGSKPNALSLIAAGGEGVYYFIDQFIWCAPACDSVYDQQQHVRAVRT